MKAFIYIGDDRIGEAELSATDESMGAIGGPFKAWSAYEKYRASVQRHTDEKGISNSDDLPYRIVLANGSGLQPQGGIGITDIKDLEEIYVESAGLDAATISAIKNTL